MVGAVQRVSPSRALFMRVGGVDNAQAMAYNAQTYALLGEYITLHGSVQPGHRGKKLDPATVSGYMGVLKAAMESHTHGKQVMSAFNTRQPKIAKTYKIDKGPKAQRAKSLGFRACHFRRALLTPFDRASAVGRFKWLVALVMHGGLMRPGEPGAGGRNKPFDPRRGLTYAQVRWWAASDTRMGRPSIVLMLLPVKRPDSWERHPVPFMARDGSGHVSDPMCVYSLLAEWWHESVGLVCSRSPPCAGDDDTQFCEQCRTTPLFRWPDSGRVWRSSDAVVVFRELAAAIDLDVDLMMGRCARIGGASDTRQVCETQFGATAGVEQGIRLLEQRGRWWTDIAWIYARAGPEGQMILSALMADADGGDMEHLLRGWTQPGRGWGAPRQR